MQFWGDFAFAVQQLFTEQKVIYEVRLVRVNICLFVLFLNFLTCSLIELGLQETLLLNIQTKHLDLKIS